jgi:hypothetical protein
MIEATEVFWIILPESLLMVYMVLNPERFCFERLYSVVIALS